MSASSALGWPRLHLRRTDSTNRVGRELAAAGAPHGALVTAAEQTAGRGRQGRAWWAPAGQALLMSLILREPPPLLPLIAGVAVCEAVGGGTAVKWPNDIVASAPDGREPRLRKVAGILAEARSAERWAVLGIGVNVAVREADLPVELRGRAASLGLAPDAVEASLSGVLASLTRWLEADSPSVLEAWSRHDALRGRDVWWAGGHGRAEGVDGEGRLIVVRRDGSSSLLDAGEVHLAVEGPGAPTRVAP